MELLVTALFTAALVLGAAFYGVDSRPIDADRATRWWPGHASIDTPLVRK